MGPAAAEEAGPGAAPLEPRSTSEAEKEDARFCRLSVRTSIEGYGRS